MKTKDIYNKPEIEIVEIQLEGMIATSLEVDDDVIIDGSARSRRRLWEED